MLKLGETVGLALWRIVLKGSGTFEAIALFRKIITNHVCVCFFLFGGKVRRHLWPWWAAPFSIFFTSRFCEVRSVGNFVWGGNTGDSRSLSVFTREPHFVGCGSLWMVAKSISHHRSETLEGFDSLVNANKRYGCHHGFTVVRNGCRASTVC